MKKLLLIPLIIFLTACAANSKVANTQTTERFKSAMQTGCLLKNKGLTEHCECWGKTLAEITPLDLQRNIIGGRASSHKLDLFAVMFNNKEKLDKCDAFKPKDVEAAKSAIKKDEEKQTAELVCPDFEYEKPQNALTDTDRFKGFSDDDIELIKSVDSSLTEEELGQHYFKEVREQMEGMAKLLKGKFGSKSSLNIEKIFKQQADNAVACSISVMNKFYSDDERDSLYRLYYASSDRDQSIESLLIARVETLGLKDEELSVYGDALQASLSCEIKKCMKK
ncbi:hypothetical protein ACFOEK_06755 [Litoribrevibacter euphylliae]|uniref:Lipoprotein n=1 Tax=Litoribrevibacter euphylliae TaxID=1834034 RepID=A0ABV7H9X7_9GAMM